MPPVRPEQLAEHHLADIAALIRDPEVLRFTRIPEPPPEDFPRRWLGMWSRLPSDPEPAG